MLRFVMAIACSFALASCGGVSYVMQEYMSVKPVPFAVEGEDVYRIFDRPEANKLMITPSVAAAMAAGAAQGVTLGAVNTMDAVGPTTRYEKAALAYLSSQNRECKITKSDRVLSTQWEFHYDCRSMGDGNRRGVR